jgi:predicted DNA-binding transcriptional regulator AlpA
MSTASQETFLSVDDLAARYDVEKQTVYHWNHQRRGPRFIKVGRFPRYRLSDVIAWEEARASDTGGEDA